MGRIRRWWRQRQADQALAAARAADTAEAQAAFNRAVSYATRGVVDDYELIDGRWRRIGGWR